MKAFIIAVENNCISQVRKDISVIWRSNIRGCLEITKKMSAGLDALSLQDMWGLVAS